MKNICVVGIGNLGLRHYQALLNVDFDVALFLVEPVATALSSAKNHFDITNDKIKVVRFLQNIRDLSDDMDLAVIATNSDVRAQVTKDLVSARNVSRILFEKVLFQATEEYLEIGELLTEHSIQAWVNCPRRLYPYYQDIKNRLNNKPIFYGVNGWEPACNSIHFVDHMEWLTGETLAAVNTAKLEKKILESKRKGFVELVGELELEFSGGSRLVMKSPVEGKIIRDIEISNNQYKFELDELNNICKQTNSDGLKKKYEIRPLYQSELTNLVAKEMIFRNTSALVSYENSSRQHLKLLDAFKKHIYAVNKTYIKNNRVPIT